MSESNDRFQEAARHAVGSVLLFRENPRGGSYGDDLDKKRATRIAESHPDGDELYALLLAVAEKAAEEARSAHLFAKASLIHEVSRLAESTDSLSLHRFIEKWSAQ